MGNKNKKIVEINEDSNSSECEEIYEESDYDTSYEDSDEDYEEESEGQQTDEEESEEETDEELTLIDFLNDYDIRISNNEFINLQDFVNKIIQSKNPDSYIKKIKNKKLIKKKFYIDEECCLQLLNKGKSKICKGIIS